MIKRQSRLEAVLIAIIFALVSACSQVNRDIDYDDISYDPTAYHAGLETTQPPERDSEANTDTFARDGIILSTVLFPFCLYLGMHVAAELAVRSIPCVPVAGLRDDLDNDDKERGEYSEKFGDCVWGR